MSILLYEMAWWEARIQPFTAQYERPCQLDYCSPSIQISFASRLAHVAQLTSLRFIGSSDARVFTNLYLLLFSISALSSSVYLSWMPTKPQVSNPTLSKTLSKMPLKMEPLDESVDWPEVGQCLHVSYTDPPQTGYRIIRPMFDISPEGIAQSVERYTEQMQGSQKPEEGSIWFKVVDTDSGCIVAGCWWEIFEKNPFEKIQHSQQSAWPEGGQRDFATAAMNNVRNVRQTLFSRPHVCRCSVV